MHSPSRPLIIKRKLHLFSCISFFFLLFFLVCEWINRCMQKNISMPRSLCSFKSLVALLAGKWLDLESILYHLLLIRQSKNCERSCFEHLIRWVVLLSTQPKISYKDFWAILHSAHVYNPINWFFHICFCWMILDCSWGFTFSCSSFMIPIYIFLWFHGRIFASIIQ